MATETLANLRTRIRQRTDNEHTGEDFVTDAELNTLINKSYYELFAELVKAGLHSVAESSTTVTATGATTYALPDDLFAIQDVYRVVGTTRIRLTRHNSRERPNAGVTGDASSYRNYGVGTGALLSLYPMPSSGSYEVYYVPIPTALSADGDTVDGVIGWEEYIVLDVSIDVLMKEGLDTAPLLFRKQQMLKRIQEEAGMRDLHEDHRIANVRGVFGDNSESLFDQYGYLPGGYR